MASAYSMLNPMCIYRAMRRALDIQTLASVGFVGTFIASEWAAWQLACYPASAWAWRLNMDVFRAFEQARMGLKAADIVFSSASLPIGSAILLAIIVAHGFSNRFAIALFANLSFVGSLMLAYGAVHDESARRSAWALAAFSHDTPLMLVAGLVATSFLGFAVSHLSFVRAIWAGEQRLGQADQEATIPLLKEMPSWGACGCLSSGPLRRDAAVRLLT